MPQPGTEPETQTCALTGNRTGDLLLYGTTPNQATLVRARYNFLTWVLPLVGFSALNITNYGFHSLSQEEAGWKQGLPDHFI